MDAGVDIIFDMTRLALVGAVEVAANIFMIEKARRLVLERVDSERPDLAILVDYPGFNLRLARDLEKRSIPVAYYISPQIWAWGMSRLKTIKRCVRKVVVFFRFEEELYRKAGVDAEWVGHPLVDSVKAALSREEFFKRHGLSLKKTTIGLLPGSREMEVKSLLGIMAGAGRIIGSKRVNCQFLVARYPALDKAIYEEALRDSGLDLRIIDGAAYDILSASDFAIVASGTATLESAIIGTPFVIVYRANLLTYILYRLVRRTRWLGLVNVIAGREVVPELTQFRATPENIAAAVTELLGDEAGLSRMRVELGRVRSSLGPGGASLRAARAILPLL
jgi:lipid-A-disaccharide synthase